MTSPSDRMNLHKDCGRCKHFPVPSGEMPCRTCVGDPEHPNFTPAKPLSQTSTRSHAYTAGTAGSRKIDAGLKKGARIHAPFNTETK
jgi:hypothetical protein